jgi:hypothetical protein
MLNDLKKWILILSFLGVLFAGFSALSSNKYKSDAETKFVSADGVLSSFSQNNEYLYLLGDDAETWEIQTSSVIESDPELVTNSPSLGIKYSLKLKNGAIIKMNKQEFEVGKNIVNGYSCDKSPTSGCGEKPSGCDPSNCCKKGWCCGDTPRCCLSSCCSK